ncbi:MAG TPA: class I SAM-dependent methyltransferase [Armatimonadota bacterium]|nr:class I SAM-dependent methyltransferase [Armatimonadota bacterium]
MKDRSNKAFWDEIYRSREALWSGNPNLQLVAETSDLAPGAALDAGCGEGADAIWLAERGWRVTAVDVSSVALDRARAVRVGDEVAQRIEWRQKDLLAWTPPPDTYDLVSSQFIHLTPEPRALLFRRLAASVKRGGTLLIVGHHPSDLQTTARRPPGPELLYTAAEVAALVEPDRWDIIVEDSRGRTVTDPAGQPITVHDSVFRARRRTEDARERVSV